MIWWVEVFVGVFVAGFVGASAGVLIVAAVATWWRARRARQHLAPVCMLFEGDDRTRRGRA